MEWKKDFCVGLSGIDEAHQDLANAVTGIEQAVARGESSSAIAAAIELFIAQTRSHFNDELTLMRVYDYPDIAAHIQDHKTFLSLLDNLRRTSVSKNTTHEDVAFLHTWLEQHLLSYDKVYYAHFARTWQPALLAKQR